MSYKFGSALVPGAYHYGGGGLGLLGSAVPSDGDRGPSYLFNDLALPADADKEVRGLVITPPGAGTWFAWEDGSFSLTGAPDGVYTFVYRLFVDGVDSGTATGTITIGAAVGGDLSGSLTMDGVTAAGGASTGVSTLSGAVTLDGLGSSGALAGWQDLVIPAYVSQDLRRNWTARTVAQIGREGMTNTPLGPKDPEEIKALKFPFARELNGATITTVEALTVTLYKGADTSPADVKLGDPVVSGTDVLQRVQGGMDGAAYKFRVKVLDSAGNRHVMTDWLAVQTL